MPEDFANAVHRVVVLAIETVVTIDFAMPVQAFGDSGQHGYQVTGATAVPGLVRTHAGPPFYIEAGLDQLASADTVIVPGFQVDDATIPDSVLTALRAAHDRGARLASICSGAFALAAAGLLDGRRATTHWSRAAQLRREYPRIDVDPDALYVDEGQIVTSAGVAAGVDLCLHLIERDRGPDAALQVARAMVVPRHRAGGQAQYRPTETTALDDAVGAALAWAAEHAATPITVADIAARAAVSERSLHRHCRRATGHAPAAWLNRERVMLACRLLEDPRLSIDAVAVGSGLGTSDNLRLHFRRVLGTTPSRYRESFGPGRRSVTH